MAVDPILRAHRDWISTLQPVGLVVSPPALVTAGAIPDQNIIAQQRALLALMAPTPEGPRAHASVAQPVRLEALLTEVLGWKPTRLVAGSDLPDALSVVLTEFGETLRPTCAVRAFPEDGVEWMMLLHELDPGVGLDTPSTDDARRWHASPQVRFERLLHETSVPVGLLSNGRELRLVYAPRGESSGHITWPLSAMGTVMNRPLLSALCMLLGHARLFTLPQKQRLPTILRESRRYQNIVSTKLAGQVLEALNELLRGFQSANEATHGRLLDDTVRTDPDHVYGGLLAVLLRLVFVLYAEERGLLSSSAVYVRHYALGGLFEALRADAGRYPDTMDQRYGAWSRLLVLFRMVHDGARRGDLQFPPRYGHLFDPDGWAFLEGRPYGVRRVMGAPVEVPKVADGVVLRVLEKLLVLDGDRLSYRALDVEQIGSVYENIMGFRLQRATEVSLGVGTDHVVVGLETLLAKKGTEREKHLKATADVALTGGALESLKRATTVDDLVAALGKRVSALTPRAVAAGGLFLQPTDERRNSGSHYTPRELTAPIVQTTLRPILEGLGVEATPAVVLALKVCDPAMGSGAFLVEACRQLGARLVTAYDLHGRPNNLAPDEDLQLYAQRQVAQHCLYGVDKNPFAVDLGKLSLWLATLARTHAFTFLDHAVRCGDSLVGLSREQIASFHWAPVAQVPVIRAVVDRAIGEALGLRREIQALAGSDDVEEKQRLLRDADEAVARVRRVGDCVVASFFAEEKAKARETARRGWEAKTLAWFTGQGSDAEIVGLVESLRGGDKPVPCFHWEIEFPEVFSGGRGGFDAVVGNPPFAGKNTIAAGNRGAYIDWLKTVHSESHGASDLVAHFFRRAFLRLRPEGTFGLIATNTLYQGDTRATGLRWICTHGGSLYAASRRQHWPGLANVVVCVVHGYRGQWSESCVLNGREVQRITAFLAPLGDDKDPKALKANEDRSFQGSILLGMGFTFDDRAKDRDAVNSLADRERLIANDKRNAERIFPYLGGDELTDHPEQKHYRYAINFGDMTEEEARAWPDLMKIVEEKVKPKRLTDNRPSYAKYWWKYAERRGELYRSLATKHRALAISRHTHYASFGWLPTNVVFSEALVVFADERDSFFAFMQSRVHEIWARFFSSSMKDDLRYSPSDCFVTFPFPPDWEDHPALDDAGRAYDAHRRQVMLQTRQGLTDTYNRFHDREESSPDIVRLRRLHDAMDRAVLDTYGWTDLQPRSEFVADREVDEANEEEKVSWRYRWPETVHDEVFGRLLKLNAARAEAEARPGATPQIVAPKKRRPPASPDQPGLFSAHPKTLPAEDNKQIEEVAMDPLSSPVSIAPIKTGGDKRWPPVLQSLSLVAYRGVTDLTLNDLTSITLVVGANNAGKSSILEAAGLLLRPPDLGQWMSVVRNRDLDMNVVDGVWSLFPSGEALDADDSQQPSDFLRLVGVIAGNHRHVGAIATISRGLGTDDASGLSVRVDVNVNSDPALTLRFPSATAISHEVPMWRVFSVMPSTHTSTKAMAEHLSRVVDDGNKQIAIELLKVFDPEVTDIEVVAPLGHKAVRVTHRTRGVVDLASFGDGMRRAATLALAMARATQGVLLIDEIEAGIHPTVLRPVLAKLLEAARTVKVQVIATTHSLEAIDAIIECTSELGRDEELSAFWVQRRDGKHVVQRFDHAKLRRLREGGLDIR